MKQRTLWRWMATKVLYIALPLPFTTTKLPSPYMQMINFLVNKRRMKKNVMNKNGSTAMDILENKKGVNDKEICKSLKRAQAVGAEEARNPTKKQPDAWLKKQRSALMVVASLIATMAFQVGTNPPGGFWQDTTDSHTAGFSVMADTNNGAYNRLITSNTIGLISSLSVIILLISGLPCKQLFVVLLMIVMWIAVTSTAYTYLTSIQFVSHLKNEKSISFKVIAISCLVWVILMNSLLIGHTIRFLFKIIRQLYRFVIKLYDNTYVRPRNRSAAV